MSAKKIFGSLVASARCHSIKNHQHFIRPKPHTRQFFGGRNWDPFSDLNTALKEIERNSKEIERQFQRVGKNLGLPPFPSQSIPIQGIRGLCHH